MSVSVPTWREVREALFAAAAAGNHIDAARKAVAAFDAERSRRAQLRIDDAEVSE